MVSLRVRSHDVCRALCAWSLGCTPHGLTFLLFSSSVLLSFQQATSKNDQARQNGSFKVVCAKVHLGSKIFPFHGLFLGSCCLMCICVASLIAHCCHSDTNRFCYNSLVGQARLSISSAKMPLRPRRSRPSGPTLF